MTDKNLPEKFNVLFIGAPDVVASLRDDFIKVGAVKAEEDADHLIVGDDLSRRLSFLGRMEHKLSETSVYFYSDLVKAVTTLSQVDVDLVIVDERLKSRKRKSPPATENQDVETEEDQGPVLISAPLKPDVAEANSITLEIFSSALKKFSRRGFHFPSRRIIVILPFSSRTTNRAFQLGLANVRAVITEPITGAQLFTFATQQLYKVRECSTKKAICVSGGGLEGYIYSVGVLQALDDCLVDQNCVDFDIFCGVSSGGLAVTSLAIGVKSSEMLKSLYKKTGALEPISLATIFDFATTEFVTRIFKFVRGISSFDPIQLVQKLQELVPIGFFRGEKLKKFLERQFRRLGVTDNFSSLKKELYISATDLDTNEHVVFGEEPWRDIRISQAVRASCALPPFFLPERINGHWFTDGQLTSSSDFNIAIKKGAGLVVLIDPMVAYSSNEPGSVMSKGGFFCTIQAIKSLIQTRVSSMLKHAMDNHPDVDFMIFQPTDEVMSAMAGNPMNYRLRTELAELGYRGTIQQIVASYGVYSHKFAKHGLKIKTKEALLGLIKA